MSKQDEIFFTTVGCMDGRAQEPVAKFGRQKFGAEYPDTITEAGLVRLLAKDSIDERVIGSLKKKLFISLDKHHSKGIVVHGHQECAGNPVNDERHKEDIRKSVELVRSIVNSQAPVVGVFVKRSINYPKIWEVEEISPKYTV